MGPLPVKLDNHITDAGVFYADKTRPNGPIWVFVTGFEIYWFTNFEIRIEPSGTVSIVPITVKQYYIGPIREL